MALQSTINISIGGNQIPTLKKLVVHQDINSHHFFELHCRVDVLEDVSGELLSETRNYLGETFTIEVSALNELEGYKELQFKGVITQIKSVKGYHYNGGDVLVIKGQSSTVLADDGPHYASYQDMGLQDILTQAFDGYDKSKLEVSIDPNTTTPLLYSVQHQESAYDFAHRLAAQYGEWFYYDGMKLNFGKPAQDEEVELNYGTDLQEFSLELAPRSNKYNYFTNDFLNDENIEKKTADVSGPNGYIGFSSEKSNLLFAKETNVWVNSFNDPQLQQRLDTLVEQEKIATEMRQVELKGKSDNPGVSLGKVIVIKNAEGSYGSYRIIQVMHTVNENGKYQNSFTGISADTDVAPNTNIQAFPYSDTQVAKVKENNDPDGLGRIKVEFPWQQLLSETTPWLRIVTPHAGGDKGFHFIPEVDEEVLIGFEGGNAERPYVLGSLYNGTNKANEFKTDANNIKVIRTRSGHTIELNDTEGEEKINIYDNEGSIITFDTQAKSLYIQAIENIELQAKNIKITAEENIDIQAKGDINSASEGDTLITSQGATNLQAEGDTSISSSANILVEAITNTDIKGQNVTAEGKVAAELKGQQTKVQGQMTVIQGASGKIDVV